MPGDVRVEVKEKEKIDKYQDLFKGSEKAVRRGEDESRAYCCGSAWDDSKRIGGQY